MAEQEKEKIIQGALAKDYVLSEAFEDWAKDFRERIRGTIFEHEMLNGKTDKKGEDD